MGKKIAFWFFIIAMSWCAAWFAFNLVMGQYGLAAFQALCFGICAYSFRVCLKVWRQS